MVMKEFEEICNKKGNNLSIQEFDYLIKQLFESGYPVRVKRVPEAVWVVFETPSLYDYYNRIKTFFLKKRIETTKMPYYAQTKKILVSCRSETYDSKC